MARNKNKIPQAPIVNSLSVKYFRGIADKQTINFDKRNQIIILFGENGSGKSSFVNALEYLFKGKLDIFKPQAINKKQKPAIHQGYGEDDWEIELTFNNNRKILRNKTGLHYEKGLRKFFNYYDSFFKNASFILNRKKLLEFIEGEEKTRFDSISKLCGLNEIDSIQKSLNQSEKYFKNLLDEKNNELKEVSFSITNFLNIDEVNSRNDIVDGINVYLDKLNLPLIDEKTNLNEYINNLDDSSKYAIDKHNIGQFKEIYRKIELPQLSKTFEKLLSDYDKLAVDSISYIKQSNDILIKSRKFIESNELETCPVCENRLNEDILNEIDLKISKLNNNLENYSSFESEVHEFKKLLKNQISLLDAILKALNDISFDLTDEIKSVEELKFKLNDLLNDLNNLLNFKVSAFSLYEKYEFSSISDVYDRIEEIEVSVIDSHGEELKSVKSCISDLIKYDSITSDIKKCHAKYELSKEVLTSFNETKQEYINDLIDDIEKDVDRFYKFIHPDDEINSPSLKQTGVSKLRFYVNSFGQNADPRSFSSEGHLDSLGICIFLAFMKKFNKFKFIVLDDVITSVDLSHKDKIARLIVSEFKLYKVLITTHNPLWAEQLQRISEGSGRNSEILHITNWKIGMGPTIQNHKSTPEKIQKYLNEGDFNGAVNASRRYLEYLLGEFCENHSVNLKLKERYSVGDLKVPVKLKSESMVEGTNLKEYVDFLWKELKMVDFIGNKLSHHNKDSYLLTGSEVVPFCNLVIELNKALNCCLDCPFNKELEFDSVTHEVKCVSECDLRK